MNYISIALILIIVVIMDVLLITKSDDHWRRIGIGNMIFTIIIAALVLLEFAANQ